MDNQLKKDIQDHFHAEYYEKQKAGKTGFWKIFDNLNDKVDASFRQLRLSAPWVALIGAVVLLAVVPPAGVTAFGLLAANMVGQIYSALNDHAKASLAVDADIVNGKLPERYQDALDDKIKNLGEKIGAYQAQKALLPAKGTASATFAAAVSGAANEAEAPAPAPAPQPALQPKN